MGGSFDLRGRPWSRRHAPCSNRPRCAAELRAGHAATPRGWVIWLRRAWPVFVARAPAPATLFFLLFGRKSAQTCQKSGGFHQGEIFRGRFLPSILAAAMGEEEKGQVGDVRVFRQPPLFLCLLSELMKTTRFLAGSPPLKMHAATLRGYAVGGGRSE